MQPLPQPGDSEADLLAKLLAKLGGSPLPGDSRHDLFRRLLCLTGGCPHPGDTLVGLLAEFLRRQGGHPTPADSYATLLRKLVIQDGRYPSYPSDSPRDSLAKLCRAARPFDEFSFLVDGDGSKVSFGEAGDRIVVVI